MDESKKTDPKNQRPEGKVPKNVFVLWMNLKKKKKKKNEQTLIHEIWGKIMKKRKKILIYKKGKKYLKKEQNCKNWKKL